MERLQNEQILKRSFITAIISERRAAEGRPRWITKCWSWVGGRRPLLADARLILAPFRVPWLLLILSSGRFPQQLIATFAFEFQMSLLHKTHHTFIKQVYFGPAFGGP